MNINYNKDLNPRLFGRDSSGKSSSSAPADATLTQQKPVEQTQDKPKAKPAPEYRITDIEIVTPADGLKKDQPFDVKGKIQPLAGTITKKKIYIKLITRYQGQEDNIGAINADIDTGNNTFAGTCKQLFYHDGYQRDKSKPAGAKFTLEAKGSSSGAEKEVTSKPIDLPMVTATIILKKGKFDENWSAKNPATHPRSSKDFIPDNKIKKLQENLFKIRLLPQNGSTGLFDEATHNAVWKFQDLARNVDRKKANDTRITKLTQDKLTLTDEPDGEVGPNTEKEIALWMQNNWVKPDPEFHKEDIDDNGVKNKHGERGGGKHHPGTGLTEVQNILAEIAAYRGKIDGWFHVILEKGLKLFQECAEKGEFVDAQGKKVVLDKKDRLKEYRKGVVDGPTVEAAKKVKERGLKVPKQTQTSIKDICEKHWEAHKNDCSGFVKAVAKELKVSLTGQANDIVDQIQKEPWKILKDGKDADAEAKMGEFVIAGLKATGNGHVAIIVPGSLAHEKYPTGYWGSIAGVGRKNLTINYSWEKTERDKVIYASIQI